jgi:single-strand DNA-binding protein
MALNINKVQLAGRVGQDVQGGEFKDGTPYANVTLATSESWKDKETGEPQEHTEWHKLCFTRGQAKVVIEHVKKGSEIYVEGKSKTRKWTDKDGVERYTTEIHVDQFQFVGKKAAEKAE